MKYEYTTTPIIIKKTIKKRAMELYEKTETSASFGQFLGNLLITGLKFEERFFKNQEQSFEKLKKGVTEKNIQKQQIDNEWWNQLSVEEHLEMLLSGQREKQPEPIITNSGCKIIPFPTKASILKGA